MLRFHELSPSPNHLKVRMALQADPTIQYALGRRRPTRVFYRDLRVNSPYNTYRNFGLPPGSIASPGSSGSTMNVAISRRRPA